LGEHLGVWIVVKEIDPPVAGDEQAAALPAGERRDEVVGRGELHVDVEPILELADGRERSFWLGVELQIDVRGALPPAVKHRGSPAGEIDPARTAALPAESLEQAPNAVGGG